MKNDLFGLQIGAGTGNYLLNIDQDYKTKNTNYNHATIIISRINQFNAEHIGVMSIGAPEFGQYFTQMAQTCSMQAKG